MGITAGNFSQSGPGSVVGIATAYGLDGPGIESRWERDFPCYSRVLGTAESHSNGTHKESLLCFVLFGP